MEVTLDVEVITRDSVPKGATTIIAPIATKIEDSAFAKHPTVKEFHGPKITVIQGSAFYGCKQLRVVDVPNVTKIEGYTFSSCINLTTLSIQATSVIERHAFYDAFRLRSITLPNCTAIRYEAFSGCTALKAVDAPICKMVGDNAFSRCVSLKTLIFPKLTTINSGAFMRCDQLEFVDLPACTTIGYEAFGSCENLKTVDAPNCTTIEDVVFDHCPSMERLRLGRLYTFDMLEGVFAARSLRDCLRVGSCVEAANPTVTAEIEWTFHPDGTRESTLTSLRCEPNEILISDMSGDGLTVTIPGTGDFDVCNLIREANADVNAFELSDGFYVTFPEDPNLRTYGEVTANDVYEQAQRGWQPSQGIELWYGDPPEQQSFVDACL